MVRAHYRTEISEAGRRQLRGLHSFPNRQLSEQQSVQVKLHSDNTIYGSIANCGRQVKGASPKAKSGQAGDDQPEVDADRRSLTREPLAVVLVEWRCAI